MDYKVYPFFKSQYSIGRSVLSLEKPSEKPEIFAKDGVSNPDSIFSILQRENMDEFFLIEDSMSGFLKACLNAKELKKKLRFGLRLTILDNVNDKTPESLKKESKVVIFAKNILGYKELIKLWSRAAQDGFYYIPRADCNILAGLNLDTLKLVVPFYDSFIHKNNFELGQCLPDFLSKFKEVNFSIEDNDTPIDDTLKSMVKDFTRDNGFKTINTKSIYYTKRADFLAYLTFRAIHNRSLLSKPELDGLCSEEFCFESWKETNVI